MVAHANRVRTVFFNVPVHRNTKANVANFVSTSYSSSYDLLYRRCIQAKFVNQTHARMVELVAHTASTLTLVTVLLVLPVEIVKRVGNSDLSARSLYLQIFLR